MISLLIIRCARVVSFNTTLYFIFFTHPSEFALYIKNRYCRCHYTKSNPIDDHSNISSKKLQKQNFKPLGHYTCRQCGTSHLQKVQENILSRIILATYTKFTVATVRFTKNVRGVWGKGALAPHFFYWGGGGQWYVCAPHF